MQPWALSFGQKRDLLMNDDAGIRAESRAILEDTAEHRAAVVNRYAASVDRGGDATAASRSSRASAPPAIISAAAPGRCRSRSRHRPPSTAAFAAGGRPVAEPVDRAGLRDVLVKRTSGQTEAGTLAAQSAAFDHAPPGGPDSGRARARDQAAHRPWPVHHARGSGQGHQPGRHGGLARLRDQTMTRHSTHVLFLATSATPN